MINMTSYNTGAISRDMAYVGCGIESVGGGWGLFLGRVGVTISQVTQYAKFLLLLSYYCNLISL